MERRPVSKREYEILVDQNVGICRSCQSLIWQEMDRFNLEPLDCDKCKTKRAVIRIEAAEREGLLVVKDDDINRIFV